MKALIADLTAIERLLTEAGDRIAMIRPYVTDLLIRELLEPLCRPCGPDAEMTAEKWSPQPYGPAPQLDPAGRPIDDLDVARDRTGPGDTVVDGVMRSAARDFEMPASEKPARKPRKAKNGNSDNSEIPPAQPANITDRAGNITDPSRNITEPAATTPPPADPPRNGLVEIESPDDVPFDIPGPGKCRVCGCTDEDCSQCIEKTGEPCRWVDEDLCSACAEAMDDNEIGDESGPVPAADDPYPIGVATAEVDRHGQNWWKCKKCGGDWREPKKGTGPCHKRRRYDPAYVGSIDSKRGDRPPAVDPDDDQVEQLSVTKDSKEIAKRLDTAASDELGIRAGDFVCTSYHTGPYVVCHVSKHASGFSLACRSIKDPASPPTSRDPDSWISEIRRDGDRYLSGGDNGPNAAIPGQPEVFKIAPADLIDKWNEIDRWRRKDFPVVGSTPEPPVVKLPTDEADRKARKREADRKYAAKKREQKLLDKALGNARESTGEPAGSIHREPVITGPTKPVERLAPKHWSAETTDMMDLTGPALRALDALKVTTAGELADWLATQAPPLPPFVVSKPWPEILEECRVALDDLKKSHERPDAEPSPPLIEWDVFTTKNGESIFDRTAPRKRLGSVQAADRNSALNLATENFVRNGKANGIEVAEAAAKKTRGAKAEPVPAHELGDWRSARISDLGLNASMSRVAMQLGLACAGELDDWVRSGPMAPLPFNTLDTVPQIVDAFKEAVYLAKGRAYRPAKAEPIDGVFIAWGDGKAGRHTNPLYAIRAPLLKAAVDYVKSQHPKDSRIEVRPDDGTFTARKLTIQADLTPTPVRRWEIFDRRTDPAKKLGEVPGANSTRALMEAEHAWPDTPKRYIEIREIVRGHRSAPPAKPADRSPARDPDRELADFRREWDQEGERAAERLERREPDPEPAQREKEAVS